MGHVAVDREDQSWTAELVNELRRHDPDHAAMPPLAPDDEHVVRPDFGVGGDHAISKAAAIARTATVRTMAEMSTCN